MWGDDGTLPWGCALFLLILAAAIFGPTILSALGII